MFDLEQAIADWRRQMLAVGIKAPVPLEELEIHLREDIAQQMQSGLSAQQAFGIAARKIGQAPELKREFKKIGTPMETQKIIKLAGVICVAVALFCQLFTCPPFVFAFGFSLMTRVLLLAVWAITVATTVLSWRYNHKLLPVIRNQPLRRAVGIVCYMGCLLWMRFVLFHLPEFATGSLSLLVFLFGSEWTVMAILGGVGHGLEKAASGQEQTAARHVLSLAPAKARETIAHTLDALAHREVIEYLLFGDLQHGSSRLYDRAKCGADLQVRGRRPRRPGLELLISPEPDLEVRRGRGRPPH